MYVFHLSFFHRNLPSFYLQTNLRWFTKALKWFKFLIWKYNSFKNHLWELYLELMNKFIHFNSCSIANRSLAKDYFDESNVNLLWQIDKALFLKSRLLLFAWLIKWLNPESPQYYSSGSRHHTILASTTTPPNPSNWNSQSVLGIFVFDLTIVNLEKN